MATAALPSPRGYELAKLNLFLQKIIENEKQNRLVEMSYAYEMKRRTITSSEARMETFEVIPLEDGDYKRRVERDGKPLSESEQKKEQDKLEKEFEKRSGLSETEKAKLEKKRLERRQKEERFWSEMLRAFAFRQTGQEEHENHPTKVIDFSPRSDYEPPEEYADFRLLKKLKGRLWVDEMDLQIVRAEIEFVEDFKMAAGLLIKINKGTTYSVVQKKVRDEVWLPYHDEITAQGRFLFFKGFELKIVSDYGSYRKFQTEVSLHPAEGQP
jgi:hypothetical protein